MLTDQDLEAALRRYRATGPSSELGPAIVATSLEPSRRFEWIWGPAAACAVLVVWVAFQVSISEQPADPARADEVAFVTEILGGGQDAAAYAEYVVPDPPKLDPSVALAHAEDAWQGN